MLLGTQVDVSMNLTVVQKHIKNKPRVWLRGMSRLRVTCYQHSKGKRKTTWTTVVPHRNTKFRFQKILFCIYMHDGSYHQDPPNRQHQDDISGAAPCSRMFSVHRKHPLCRHLKDTRQAIIHHFEHFKAKLKKRASLSCESNDNRNHLFSPVTD